MSIVAYVQEARIERAKLLLTESDRSVTEVAFAVGIASPAYFSHLFARRTALAPSGWRAERRGLDIIRRGFRSAAGFPRGQLRSVLLPGGRRSSAASDCSPPDTTSQARPGESADVPRDEEEIRR